MGKPVSRERVTVGHVKEGERERERGELATAEQMGCQLVRRNLFFLLSQQVRRTSQRDGAAETIWEAAGKAEGQGVGLGQERWEGRGEMAWPQVWGRAGGAAPAASRMHLQEEVIPGLRKITWAVQILDGQHWRTTEE